MTFSVEELGAQAGIPARTVRYYVAEGLIPGPSARGRGARYGQEHLWRLQLIRKLTAQHVPLAEIRERLSRLSTEEVRQQVDGRPARPSPKAFLADLLARAQSAPVKPKQVSPPPAGQPWRRYAFRPGLELSLRADQESRYARLWGGFMELLDEQEG